MIHYPDTSFLCAAYRRQMHTEHALAFREKMSEPLHFTGLLEFEFLQAIELQVWLHAQVRSKGYARREADGMIADWLGKDENSRFGATMHQQWSLVRRLRYGENPHQSAALYRAPRVEGPSIATSSWFLAAERTIDGPPMSMFSIASSKLQPRAVTSANG